MSRYVFIEFECEERIYRNPPASPDTDMLDWQQTVEYYYGLPSRLVYCERST